MDKRSYTTPSNIKQLLNNILPHFSFKFLAQFKKKPYFCNNRFRHASHLNSEPGRNFVFIEIAYALML